MELMNVLVMHSTKRKCLTTFYAARTVIIALEIFGRWHINFPVQKNLRFKICSPSIGMDEHNCIIDYILLFILFPSNSISYF